MVTFLKLGGARPSTNEPIATLAAGCKRLSLRRQHRRKLCQNADEPDNQAEEYDFFQWMSLDSTRLFQTRQI
jgi:hypothetical protein